MLFSGGVDAAGEEDGQVAREQRTGRKTKQGVKTMAEEVTDFD